MWIDGDEVDWTGLRGGLCLALCTGCVVDSPLSPTFDDSPFINEW